MTEAEIEAHPVTKVARDLTEILTLHRALRDQAVNHATAALFPGGEAMAALANVANVEAWDNQHQATERHDLGRNDDRFSNYRRAYTSVEDEDPDDAWSAYQLIEYWSEGWRLERGDDHDGKRTLRTEANYVRHSIDWAWENELHFDEFAADMRRARLRLEDIVYDGKRVERTRVLCDRTDCPNPRRLIKVHAMYDPTGVLDCYKCPACKHRFTEDDFQRAYRSMLISEDATVNVSLVEALATLRGFGRTDRQVRRWMAPLVHKLDECQECGLTWPAQEYPCCPVMRGGQECGGLLEPVWHGNREAIIQSYCEVGTHRVMVYWPDLWTRHLEDMARRNVALPA